MFCTKCGAEIPDGSIFCGACGSQLQTGSIPPPPLPQMQQQVAINVGQLSCPRCGGPGLKGSFRAWQIIVSICFFPIGLLSLLAGRSPSRCLSCGFIWQV